MIRLFALLLALLPTASHAQGNFPALYDVTGVAADDVLNIREAPTASAPIVGMLSPHDRSIEIVARPEGGWGKVNTGERGGWVSMRYLARQPGQAWGTYPDVFTCFGTEPFWSLKVTDDDHITFSEPEGEEYFSITGRIPGEHHPNLFAVTGEGALGRITAVITYQACSDGMSDLDYGLSVGVLSEAPSVLYSGCCVLAP